MISVEGKPFSKLDLVRETDNQALKLSCELRRCSSDWLVACFYFVSFLQHILLQTCIFLTDFFALHFFMFNLLQSLSSQPYSIVDLFFFPESFSRFMYLFFFFYTRGCQLVHAIRSQPATDTGHFTFHATTMTKARILLKSITYLDITLSFSYQSDANPCVV